MDPNQRIAQFENMAREDPSNEMAHFSLAGAYADAGRHGEATEEYRKCIELNDGMSRAYEFAGASLIACGRLDEAADILAQGYVVAAMRGDLRPRDAIAQHLRDLGREVPEVEAAAPEPPETPAAPAGQIVCARTGVKGTKMQRPPFKGPVGQWIADNISAQTFDAWIGQGTKVINELRLDLSRDEDSRIYDQHMYEFLGMDRQLLVELGVDV